MSKTKFRSLGLGFLFSALILAAVSFAWPLVPAEYKAQLNELNLPKIGETCQDVELQASSSELEQPESTEGVQNSEISSEEAAELESKLSTETPSEESETESPVLEGSPVSITVESGMISIQIADMLKEKGVITDSQEFAQYLEDNGYAQSIWVGTYELTPGMTYEEIANTIGHQQ